MEQDGLFVIAMGMAVVFVGLYCIILLTKMMSFVLGNDQEFQSVAPIAQKNSDIDNNLIGAVFAVLAEDNAIDLSNTKLTICKSL